MVTIEQRAFEWFAAVPSDQVQLIGPLSQAAPGSLDGRNPSDSIQGSQFSWNIRLHLAKCIVHLGTYSLHAAKGSEIGNHQTSRACYHTDKSVWEAFY